MSDGFDFPGYDLPPRRQALAATRFDPAAAAWVALSERARSVRADALTLATFNTWFQGPEPATRHAGLLAALERSDADVIVLQEVTVALLAALRESAWVRARYLIVHAPIRADAIPSHGIALLARLPVRGPMLHPIPSNMGRRLLTAELALEGAPLLVATVHLESMRSHADTRGEQLRAIFALLEDAPDVLLAGDFNFCSAWPDENRRIDARYTDLWPMLRPGEPGYTQDTGRNAMLAKAKGQARQVRIDRILLRSDGARWRPVSIELIGTQPAEPRRPKIFPSDHFGLTAAVGRT